MPEKVVKVTRVFNAPVESVWKMWTDAEMVKRWWGPDHFTCPVAEMDFREGGTSLVAMRAPKEMNHTVSYSIWQYTKIVLHESIEFIQNLADEKGNKVKPVSIGMPHDFPEDIRTLVILKVLGKKQTEITVTEFADMGQMSHFAQLGLEQCMDKMGAGLPTE